MPRYEYRELKPTAEGEETYRRWLAHLDEELTRHKEPRLRGELVRDALHQIYLGRPHGGKLNTTLISELPGNVLQLSLDPRQCDPRTRVLRRHRRGEVCRA